MSGTSDVTVQPYRTNDHLDRKLASLAYAAVRGWPDQRPITKDLVASRLRPPPSTQDTVLALSHRGEQLVGWAAVRSAPPGGTARLWGPVIDPGAQHAGIGHRLLQVLTATHTYLDCCDRITTAEIPSQRTAAHEFFHRADWTQLSTATLLHVRPIGTPPPSSSGDLTITALEAHDRVSVDIAHLYQATYPHHGANIAAATLGRWSADRRYTPGNLLVARTSDSQPVAAALLYPLAHSDDTEPPEVLLADILLAAHRQRRALLEAVVDAALNRAATYTSATLRCITTDGQLARHLTRRGARTSDTMVYLAPPTHHP
jgi:hypothetical protein